MPLDPSLNYVPLDSTQKQILQNYMEDIIRQDGLKPADAAQRAGEKFARAMGLDTYDWGPLQNLARAAQKGVDAGKAMRDDPGFTPPDSQIPNVSSDPVNRGLYIYDVVLVAIDPNTGDRYSTRIEITSATPMNARSIQSTVEGQRDYFIRKIKTNPPDQAIWSSLQLQTFIMDVGYAD